MRYKLTLVPDDTNEPESVLDIDAAGEPTIAIECAAGTLHADVESRRNTNHNSIYIRFTPKDATESIDIAALKDGDDDDTVNLLIWGDITSEDPDLIIPFSADEVSQVLA